MKIKYLMDKIGAILLLIILSPFMLFIGMLIKIDSKGPIVFKQKRLGIKGKIFEMYKFRTMYVDAKDIRNTDGSTFNAETDPRVTKIGRFLRKMSLDELPQLVNVIKGEMSFIGPRPDLPDHYRVYTEWERKKLDIRPGITGYAQCNGRNNTPWKQRIRQDIYYIEHYHFWLDIKIILRTIDILIKRKGVYKETIEKDSKIRVFHGKYEEYKEVFEEIHFMPHARSQKTIYFFVYENEQLKEIIALEYLKWDTQHFQKKIGSVFNIYSTDSKAEILDVLLEAVEVYGVENQYECLYGRAYGDQFSWIHSLEKRGFRLEDTIIRFQRDIDHAVEKTKSDSYTVQAVQKKDMDEIKSMAADLYTHGRFFNDDHFEPSKVKELYGEWIKNDILDEMVDVWVLKDQQKAVGFISCEYDWIQHEAVMRLIGIQKRYQSKGLGNLLIRAAEAELKEKGIKRVFVGTNLNNSQAIRFYIKNKFKIEKCSYHFHKWFES